MQYDIDSFCKAYAERYVLSKAVNNIDYYFTITSKLSERDFLDPRNSILFATLKALNEKGVNVVDCKWVFKLKRKHVLGFGLKKNEKCLTE